MSKRSPVPAPADDWLAVSTDGFAALNAGRPPAHLVKELLQNGLDALGEAGGHVALNAREREEPGAILITCQDNGVGIRDLPMVRTVFFTSKTDSPLKRGRMGRGFKEMLCLARWASVSSGGRQIQFVVQDGQRRTLEGPADPRDTCGTLVQMLMPWEPEVIGQLEAYFRQVLPPANVLLVVNGTVIERREPVHVIDALLSTELFEDGRWVRSPRPTVIELVPLGPGEAPSVYELGLPVCPAEWTVPYHANVRQRVPMNPNRDAVASGYLLKLHKSCLPVLLPQMDSQEVRQDWVGSAAPHCEPHVQKQIVQLGFGPNLARSVPKMGVRQFDEDARELGVSVVDTRQTSGGFRQLLQQHVPTTREVVDQHNRARLAAAADHGFDPAEVAQDPADHPRRRLIEAVGGPQRVQQVTDFARWFCQQLLEGYADAAVCSVTVASLKAVKAVATWGEMDVLTLAIDTPWLWSEPLGEQSLAVLIHEAAHHLNAHHGRDFHQELENLAGRAARLMFQAAGLIHQRYAALLRPST